MPPAIDVPNPISTCAPAPTAAIVPPALVMVAEMALEDSCKPPAPVSSRRPLLVTFGTVRARPFAVPVASMTPFASFVRVVKLAVIAPAPEIVLSTLSSDASLSMKIELFALSDRETAPPPDRVTGLGVVCRPKVSRVRSPVEMSVICPALVVAPAIVTALLSAIAKVEPATVLREARLSLPVPPVPRLSAPPVMASVTSWAPTIEWTESTPL